MYITNSLREDGFGAQYQTIIFTILYAELKKLNFVYRPFTKMEHNYDEDNLFIEKKEKLINLKDNIKLLTEVDQNQIVDIPLSIIYQEVESKIDYCTNMDSFLFIKECFNHGKLKENQNTIDVHIRRANKFDIGEYGYTDDEYFLKVIDHILDKNKQIKKIKIHSQGNVENFEKFSGEIVDLQLNKSIEETFTNMVFSDNLVMSKGSFSYTAGLLNDNQVFYLPFWHKPKKNWIII